MFSENILIYLKDNLGAINDKGDIQAINMPLYLTESYRFREVEILNHIFVLIEVLNSSDLNISKLEQRRSKLRDYFEKQMTLVFVFHELSDYLRLKLIKEQLSFVIPGKQIFILELGLVFSERMNSKYTSDYFLKVNKMMPISQSLLIYLLETNALNNTMSEISKKLSVTPMSISRGFQELKSLKLIIEDKQAKSERFSFNGSRKEVWEAAQPFLTTPIMRSIYIDPESIRDIQLNTLIISGESALAHYSMLSSPNIQVFGIHKNVYKKISKTFKEYPNCEENSIILQLYNQPLSSKDGILTELSTALVLKDEKDERVNGAVENMIHEYFGEEVLNGDKQSNW